MNVSFFGELLTTISDRGRQLLDFSGIAGNQGDTVESLSQALLSGRGEASGVALARQILSRYRELNDERRLAFFQVLATSFLPDADKVATAARAYLQGPDQDALKRLTDALEPPREE